ncbi:MAG: hypothetical protein Aurels2KO_51550 [Aureliella sp.]
MEEVPFEDRHVPHVQVDWDRSAWWWYPLTRVVHPAMRMTSLVLSVFAVVLVRAGMQLGEWLFSPAWESGIRLDSSTNVLPSTTALEWLSRLAKDLAAAESLRWNEVAFVSFEMLWITLVVAAFGGVLTRRAAIELGQRTIGTWSESFRIVFSRLNSYLWATGMHLVALSLLLLPFLLLGWLSRLGGVGANIAGVLMLLMFPLVFSVGRFAFSAIICFPVSVAAISIEKEADAFEGFSRSNAYLIQRPIAAAVCILLLLGAGLVGEQIVYWSLNSGWWLISRTFATTAAESQTVYLNAGDWLTGSLVTAFGFSFFWAAVAAVYLILRKSVDHAELDQISEIESKVEKTLPDIPSTPPQPEPATAASDQAEPSSDSTDSEA